MRQRAHARRIAACFTVGQLRVDFVERVDAHKQVFLLLALDGRVNFGARQNLRAEHASAGETARKTRAKNAANVRCCTDRPASPLRCLSRIANVSRDGP
eukprot:5685848-Pleurochrysis_carterae.AAC.1